MMNTCDKTRAKRDLGFSLDYTCDKTRAKRDLGFSLIIK